MSEIYSPQEIRERFGSLPYITPYSRIIAMVDEDSGLVELHEYHARDRCTGGAAWEVFHYATTSPLVLSARRDGARNIFVCRQGSEELSLLPGVAGAGLRQVTVEDGQVALTYAGLAGGGVAATLCRGMADNVLSAEVHERGGGASLGSATLRVPAWSKLTIGVDDTDDAERGATWSTMNEIACELERQTGAVYLLHAIAQLFPDNPFKTTNCCATAVTMGVARDEVLSLLERTISMVRERSFSPETGMAWTGGIPVAEGLCNFTSAARAGMVTIEDARRAAGESGAEMLSVTGQRGCIGAVAALGVSDAPDDAVRLASGDA